MPRISSYFRTQILSPLFSMQHIFSWVCLFCFSSLITICIKTYSHFTTQYFLCFEGHLILNRYLCNFHAADAAGYVLLQKKMNLGHSGCDLAVAVGQQSGFIRFVCSAGLMKNKLEVQQLRCHAHSAMLNISLSSLR